MRGLDMFCGVGGSSAGARDAGVEMIGAVDMCPLATETYRANFPASHVVTSRLEQLNVKELQDQLGDIDILIASPECTNHSCAKGAAPRNEASRATAMYIVEYARVFKPRWLVLENVVHMRPWSRYGELKSMFEQLGYQVGEQVLNASDFGVAQTRRRLFIVGDRMREPQLVRSKRRGRKRTAASVLDAAGTWDTTSLRHRSRAKATLQRAQRGFRELGATASFLLVYYGSDGAGGWQPLDRPLRTVTTIDRFALIQPGPSGPEMRMLQVPELKRAMGFHETHSLPVGTRRDRIRLLGNAVCPPVMRTVVESLTAD